MNGDYTCKDIWEQNGETYIFVEDYLDRACESGECHNVIVTRLSDGLFFKFCWSYSNGEYYFEDELEQIFPLTTITKKYI